MPTNQPTQAPTLMPTNQPTQAPTLMPTNQPTQAPTLMPTNQPTQTLLPTLAPTILPTVAPTMDVSIPGECDYCTFSQIDYIKACKKVASSCTVARSMWSEIKPGCLLTACFDSPIVLGMRERERERDVSKKKNIYTL
jgi:hypothetical protein